MTVNIVEHIAEPDECAFDQPCRFGHRVEGHAVYCHNDAWESGPRKCRRTWYTGGEVKDEDCPGFEPNEAFSGEMKPSLIAEPLCAKCKGRRLLATDRGRTETCRHCCGDGSEPHAMALSQYEQDTLELGSMGGRPGGPYVRVAADEVERDGVSKLLDADLVDIRSMTWAADHTVYLLELTGKGEAVMRANWAKKRQQ